MSKQVITVDGEDMVVREDTAKSYRGVHWAWFTLIMMIVVTGLLFFFGVLKLGTGSSNPGRTPETQQSEPGP